MAYVFGFFFGRTPLIQLSPKKTWEGFIGGGFATVIFGLVVSECYILERKYLICVMSQECCVNNISGRVVIEWHKLGTCVCWC